MARSWYDKFADAGRGLRVAVTGHNSFIVHLVCAVGVCGLAVWLNLQLWRWVAIIGCIVMVLVLELIKPRSNTWHERSRRSGIRRLVGRSTSLLRPF